MLIIDGYNLIRKVPLFSRAEESGLENGRRYLLDALARYKRRTGHRIVVVFDGDSGREYRSGIEIRYHRPADDLIVSMAGSGALVVTSDREVFWKAEDRGALACTSEEFAELLVDVPTSRGYLEEEDYPEGPPKKGNPRRLSKKAREEKRKKKRIRTILEGRR